MNWHVVDFLVLCHIAIAVKSVQVITIVAVLALIENILN